MKAITKKSCLVSLLLFLGTTAVAQDAPDDGLSGRWEVWLGPMFWPAATDLQPLAPGKFDAVGIGLGGAYHVPVRRMEHSDLLVGVDLSFAGIDSNVSAFLSDITVRHLYFGLSGKWLFGSDRNVSLDAGFGYHEADLAEVSTTYWGMEHQLWTRSRAGAYVGATWDVSRGLPGRKNGLFFAVKAHFVDFGEVYDQDVILGPVLGAGAGSLDGPIYMLQIGYSGR